MPHLTVEYGGVEMAQEALPELQQTLLNSGLFEEHDLKIRLCRYEQVDYLVGGSKQAFAHLILRLLEGRSKSAQAELSRALAETVQKLTAQAPSIQISVDLCDMVRATYTKTHR